MIGLLLAVAVLAAALALWFVEVRPVWQWEEYSPRRIWTNTTMHGTPWWRIHLWPHLVGGATLLTLLVLPGVDSPATVPGKLCVVGLIQLAWELTQIVTWSPNPAIARWAILWSPLEHPDQFPQIWIHAGLGLLWITWHPIQLALGPLGWLLGVVILQLLYTRLQHENWRKDYPFPWVRAVGYGAVWAVLGALVGLVILGVLP